MPTEPTSPDLSFSGLLNALDDNNSGAITPEDVRSVAALSRPSTATIGSAGIGTAGLIALFDADDKLNTNDDINFARLAKFSSVAGANNYNYFTGHLDMNDGSVSPSPIGIQYTNPETAGQHRSFNYEWEIVLKSSSKTLWALTFYYLPSTANWPTSSTDTSWDDVRIHHSEAFYASGYQVISGSDVWQAASSGSRTINLAPGDTVVPVLEYWGEVDGSYDISAQDAQVVKFHMTTVSQGVVDDGWDDDEDYWTVESNRPRAEYDLLNQGTVAVDGTLRLSTVVCTSTTRPSTPTQGQRIYETNTGHELVYLNSFLGWNKPWNLPWGQVAEITPPSASGGGPGRTDGYPAAGVTSPTPTDTGFTMSVNAVKNRKYRMTITGHTVAFENEDKLTGNGGTGGTSMFTSAIFTGTDPSGSVTVGTGGGAFSGLISMKGQLVLDVDGTPEVYEAVTATVSVYEGAKQVAAQSNQTVGTYASMFNLSFDFVASSTGTKNFSLKINAVTGDDKQYVFHSPATKRPVTGIVQDIGPGGSLPTS